MFCEFILKGIFRSSVYKRNFAINIIFFDKGKNISVQLKTN